MTSIEEESKISGNQRDRAVSSDSFLSVAGQSTSSIAQIEAYTKELKDLRESVLCFNVSQFANAEEEFLLKLGEKIAEER